MNADRFWKGARLAVVVSALAFAGPALAQGNSPLTKEEKQLQKVESDVLTLQRKLSAARKRGDDEKVERLQKQFDELQKKRVELLRATWQM